MAHFCELDKNNIVKRVVVINNDVLMENGVEVEQKGIDYCKKLFGEDTIWIQTSYNAGNGVNYINPNAFRKNQGSFGSEYRPDLDAFIPPKPYDSWILNEENCAWEAPVPYPSDGEKYTFDDKTKNWISDGKVIYLWRENEQKWERDIFYKPN